MEFYKKVAGPEVTGETPGVLTFLGDSEEATRIEIIRGAGPAFQGTGISVGFAHPDPVAYREELSAAGYDVSDISRPNPRAVFFHVKDSNGLNVQFIDF